MRLLKPIFLLTLVILAISCTKEEVIDTPENTCFDVGLEGQYVNLTARYQSNNNVTIAPTDAEMAVAVQSLGCNQIMISIGENETFEAPCYQPTSNEVSGASTAGTGEFSFNIATKVLTIIYTDATGGQYEITAKK
jgi:hypothetical protein